MPPVLRFGVAGLGLASTFTLPEFATHPQITVTAAADPRIEARERFAQEFQADTFESVEALCASPLVDAIYLCTPNTLHAQHAILVAEHGKHLIVEKPFALTIEECEAINAAAERNGVQVLCGHTHAFNPPIRVMREIVASGQLGELTMVHTWNYTDFLYRPRLDWELDTARGGGVIFTQAPHQVEIVRTLGGGLVREVRATVGAWDPARPTEGNYTAYLEFHNGTPASMVYSGYGHFDTAELHYWVGERGQHRDPETNHATHATYRERADRPASGEEEQLRNRIRYGGAGARGRVPDARQPFFGLTLVSCRDGDLRQSPDGILVYRDDRVDEVSLAGQKSAVHAMLDEFVEAVVRDRAPPHDGRWAEATVEVCLAILRSAHERTSVLLEHQVALRA